MRKEEKKLSCALFYLHPTLANSKAAFTLPSTPLAECNFFTLFSTDVVKLSFRPCPLRDFFFITISRDRREMEPGIRLRRCILVGLRALEGVGALATAEAG